MRMPLTLVCQEVTTFLYRAVSDMMLTVEQMETARSEYRGALMWMRDVSEHLDPDAEKRLQKFRLVNIITCKHCLSDILPWTYPLLATTV